MNICLAESYSPAAVALLTAHGHTILHGLEHVASCEALLIRSGTKVNKDLLARAPALQVVVSATSGFDHIDWRECRERGVLAAHTPEANASSTAELTLALMLSWTRRLPQATHNVKTHKWRSHLLRGDGLEGKTLGLVGLGRVGSRVARLAQAFGMKVFAHDPYISEEVFQQCQVERLGFIELLRTTDYVSLHVPLTRETKHLINYPTLREMHPQTTLVNVSRGSVVDESEVIVALNENVIAGALLDVLEREPPQNDSKLLTHPKVILTPHIGAHSNSAWEKASLEAAKKIVDFGLGKSLADTLPLKTPWFDQT